MVKYGLIGYPLGHSFSAGYFNRKFEAEGIDCRYEAYPIKNIRDVDDLLQAEPELAGLNITIPYKEMIIPRLDFLSPDSEAIGAVNTVMIERTAKKRPVLYGFNTDCIGFIGSIRDWIDDGLKGRALILGSGGASKAVAFALEKSGFDVKIVSRSEPDHATGRIGYQDLTNGLIGQTDLIVNATPVGMFPHINECVDIPYDDIGPGHFCYDLIYNPSETLFLRNCKMKGARVRNGMAMLVLQAEASWNIWKNQGCPYNDLKTH